MKQFTTPPISVRFPNIETESILRADFVIKENVSRDSQPLAKARYYQTPPNTQEASDIIEVSLEGDTFTFQLDEETASHLPVEENGMPKTIWLDTRLKISDGEGGYTIPNTPIQKIRIMPTLFSEDYEAEGGEW